MRTFHTCMLLKLLKIYPHTLHCVPKRSMMSDVSNLSCYGIYKQPKYDALLAISIILSVVSIIFLFGVIFIIVLFKKYVLFHQKLILYLAIASLCFSVSTAFNFTSTTAYISIPARNYCIFMGFINQSVIWWQIMAVVCIMINIFIKAVFKIDAQRKLEILYALLIFILPFSFSWIPFIDSDFGPAGVFCWIRDREYDDCNKLFIFGTYLRFFLFYIPLYVVIFVMFILLIISFCVIRRRRKRWHNQNDHKNEIQKKIETEIRSLIAYPIIYILLSILPLIHRILGTFKDIESSDFYFVLTFIHLLIYRLLGVFITLAFAMDPETRNKLKWIEIRAAIDRWLSKEEETVKNYTFVNNERSDSFTSEDTSTSSGRYSLLEDNEQM